MTPSMDEAHRADYDEKARMDELRRQIEILLANPPSRLWPTTRSALDNAVEHLQQQADAIAKAWD